MVDLPRSVRDTETFSSHVRDHKITALLSVPCVCLVLRPLQAVLVSVYHGYDHTREQFKRRKDLSRLTVSEASAHDCLALCAWAIMWQRCLFVSW